MTMIKKSEILYKKEKYTESIEIIESKIKNINTNFGDLRLDQFIHDAPFSLIFSKTLEALKLIYEELDELKNTHNDLVLLAKYRPAKIKTGNLQKKIKKQIEILLTLEQDTNQKLREILYFYQNNIHLIFASQSLEEDLFTIIQSLEIMSDFFRTTRRGIDLNELLQQTLSTSKLAQNFNDRIHMGLEVSIGIENQLKEKIYSLEAKLNTVVAFIRELESISHKLDLKERLDQINERSLFHRFFENTEKSTTTLTTQIQNLP